MTKVDSSTVHSIGYEPDTETLTARFHCSCTKGGKQSPGPNCAKCRDTGHSGTYTYDGVPVAAYIAVRDAKKQPDGSVGRAFAKNIKKAGYKFSYKPHGA